MIRVNTPDGGVAEFPDDTPLEVIKGALQKKFAAAPPPPETTTGGDAATFGLADSLSLGFADEIGSGFGAAYDKLMGDERSWGDLYNENLTRGREFEQRAQQEHPGKYLGGQVAGAIITAPIGGGEIAAAKGLLGAAKAGAKSGAVLGGVYGLGSGEDGLGNRVSSGIEGSLLGGTVGGALPVIGSGLKGLWGAIRPAFESSDKYATRKIIQAAERAGTSVPKAMQEVNRVGKTNPEVVLADVLGKSGQRLSRAVVNKGGDGAERLFNTLGDRQAGQGERITGQVGSLLGDPAKYYGNMDNALKNLRTNAKPAYEAAYEKPIDYAAFGPALDDVFSRIPPRLQGQVVSAAKDLMRMEGVKSKQIMAKVADDGTVTFETLPDVRQWDYIKRGLDKVIEGTDGQAASGGVSQYGKVLSGVKNDLLKVLDEAVPEFGQARKIYSDDLAVKNALETGREAITMDPEVITANLSKMDDAAKRMFRAGFARAFGDQVDRVRYGNDAINRVWNTPSQQARLKAVFGSKSEFQKFAEFASGEQAMGKTWKAVSGNSTTAQQVNDLMDAGNPVFDFAAHAATGSVKNAVLSLVMRWGRTIGGLTEDRADKIADLLLSKGITPEMADAIRRRELSAAQKAKLARLVSPGALLGAETGSSSGQGW